MTRFVGISTSTRSGNRQRHDVGGGKSATTRLESYLLSKVLREGREWSCAVGKEVKEKCSKPPPLWTRERCLLISSFQVTGSFHSAVFPFLERCCRRVVD